jgi:Gas vesicle synthesis protein GvpL/GvpF
MSQQETPAAGTRGTYVYGIVRAGAQLDSVSGDAELPDVRLIEAGDIAALVSAGPERAAREVVLNHGRVLEAALDGSPVIPLRFGMVLTDDDAVRDEILDAHHDKLADFLDRLEGRVQMTLKVYYHEDVVVAEILSSNAQLAQLRETIQGKSEDAGRNERIKLGEGINAAMEQRRQSDGQEILDRLRPLADAIALEPPEDELMVAHVAFLLQRDRLEEFDAAVEEIAKPNVELMRFRLLGPMPAYNFIDLKEPAWG